MSKFTIEQENAINAVGKTIVSASAGSGKTTVMIEKIVRLIESGQADVNSILAVTFTIKAAAQMKEKLRNKLIERINSESDADKAEKLKKQLSAVSGAQISTIHSFCAKLIRSHFFLLGLDGNFAVAANDSAEITEIKQRAIDEVFDELYENADENFLKLLSVYFRKKKDENLKKIVFEAYKSLRLNADYTKMISPEFSAPSEEKFSEIQTEIFQKKHAEIVFYAERVQEELDFFKNEGDEKAVAVLEQLKTEFDTLSLKKSWCEFAGYTPEKIDRAPSTNKKYSEEKNNHVKRVGTLKDKIGGFAKIFKNVGDENTEKNAYFLAGGTAIALSALLRAFDVKFTELKKIKNVLDFSDLEHYSLDLLRREEIAKEVGEKYKFVFVDEYQDVNPVQETILSMINAENVFLVGDVKQSIYGFRGGRSEYFKKKEAELKAGNGNSLKLTVNFRSSDAVLDTVNSDFERAMTEESVHLPYAEEKMLRGGKYALGDGRTKVYFLEKEKEEKKEKQKRGVYSVAQKYEEGKLEKNDTGAYAKLVKRIILSELENEIFDPDEEDETKRKRKPTFSDIVILVRSRNAQLSSLVTELSRANIPVAADEKLNLFDFPEIKTLVDVTELVDNSARDIPLASALITSLGRCLPDDLIKIRRAYPNENFFYKACKKYAEEKKDATAQKLVAFYAVLRDLKDFSAVSSASETLRRVLTFHGLEGWLLARGGAKNVLRRIHAFLELSSMPEELSVHEFCVKMKMLEYRSDYTENGGKNAVRIMTMHGSKGLEFPIVILSDLNENTVKTDSVELLFDEKFGLAPKGYDTESMRVRETVLRFLCKEKQREENVRNELNLFYVALTRAQYGLHLIFSDPTKSLCVPYAKSFADFVDLNVWKKYLTDASELPDNDLRPPVVVGVNEDFKRAVQTELKRAYPFVGGDLPVKTSSTAQMKRLAPDDGENKTRSLVFEEDSEGDERLRGIALHAFLQFFDFSLLETTDAENAVKITISELLKEPRFSKENFAFLDERTLVRILKNPVFSSLRGYTLYREQEFLVGLPAEELYFGKDGYYGNCGDEELLFQGAIDLLAVGADGIRIIDYKYSAKDAEKLKNHYAVQLKLYRLAVCKILKTSPEKVRCTLVNIRLGYETDI